MLLAILFESVGVGEWFVLLAVVLIVVGPKNLPSTARKIGQFYAKFRRAAEGFKRQLLDMDAEISRAAAAAERTAADAFNIEGDEATAKPLDITAPLKPQIDRAMADGGSSVDSAQISPEKPLSAEG